MKAIAPLENVLTVFWFMATIMVVDYATWAIQNRNVFRVSKHSFGVELSEAFNY